MRAAQVAWIFQVVRAAGVLRAAGIGGFIHYSSGALSSSSNSEILYFKLEFVLQPNAYRMPCDSQYSMMM